MGAETKVQPAGRCNPSRCLSTTTAMQHSPPAGCQLSSLVHAGQRLGDGDGLADVDHADEHCQHHLARHVEQRQPPASGEVGRACGGGKEQVEGGLGSGSG